ncbi:hypothetical protein WN944_024327 [Citrus x changshan-huyou]|uniref:Uncharacterized protein n=1 Tax=Citrus x changshan-huyou TaxID=2935761 RepID=A0AAP0QCI5_9ROSI
MPQAHKTRFRSPHFAHPTRVHTAPLASPSRDFLLAEVLFSSANSIFERSRSSKWVNAPPYDGCSNETVGQDLGTLFPSKIQYGATRVELFRSV